MYDRILTVPYRTVPAQHLIHHLEDPEGFYVCWNFERSPQRTKVLANRFKAYNSNIV
jgi:hypothetical protein